MNLLLYPYLAQFICHGLRLWDRLRLRNIPQVPFLPRNFLVGHLTDLSRTQPCYAYTKWQQQLGGIYLAFMGKAPVVVISGEAVFRCKTAQEEEEAVQCRRRNLNSPLSYC